MVAKSDDTPRGKIGEQNFLETFISLVNFSFNKKIYIKISKKEQRKKEQ